MADSKVSFRYATSLLDMAVEKKILDSVSKDMELVLNILEENRNLMNALESPVIKPNLKLSILNEILSGKIDKESLNFIRFIVDKNREDLLYSIIKKFLEMKDEHLGIVNVVVSTAYEFTEDQKDQLKKKLHDSLNKEIRLKFIIDKNIVGGFVARVGDTVYDASVKHQLELLRKQFLESGFSLN